MSRKTYHPERGDLILINFFPAAGREIDKRRPAVVISPLVYNRATGFCLCAPVTTDLTPGPLWIRLEPPLLNRPSQVLCDRLRSFDYRERSVEFVGKIPRETMDEIITILLEFIDPME